MDRWEQQEVNAKSFRRRVTLYITLAIMSFITVIAGGMWGCPQYNVWMMELSGKAKFREAEWSRQVAIEEAEAVKESASHLADAEVIRATGVAKANTIIGESLSGELGEAYLPQYG